MRMIRFVPGTLLLLATAAAAQSPTGRQVMEAYERQDRTRDTEVDVTMSIIDAGGAARKRQITLRTRTGEDGSRMQLIRFESPADVAGTGFLSIENADGEDDTWLYLPALRRARRIAGTDRQDSFMGTDFSYEDLDPEDLDDHAYRTIGEDTIAGRAAWVVESTPAPSAEETAYGRRELWIDRERHVLLRARFYDRDGNLVKRLTASGIQRLAGTDRWRPHRLVMEDVQAGTRTVLDFSEYAIDEGVPERYFSLRYLRRGG